MTAGLQHAPDAARHFAEREVRTSANAGSDRAPAPQAPGIGAPVAELAAAGPMDYAVRLAAHQFDPETLEWAAEAMEAWFNAEGKAAMEDCFHLPSTPAKARAARRNVWLVKAYDAMEQETPWLRCKALSKQLEEFVSRGEWRLWKSRREPPDTDGLTAALFLIAKLTPQRSNAGCLLSAVQMLRIIRNIFNRRNVSSSPPSLTHAELRRVSNGKDHG